MNSGMQNASMSMRNSDEFIALANTLEPLEQFCIKIKPLSKQLLYVSELSVICFIPCVVANASGKLVELVL
jgi:hypothetical protein